MVFVYGFITLGLLVFTHEFGHFLLAKAFRVQVEEFGFGYPPRLGGLVKSKGKTKFFWGKKNPKADKGATIYSLNWIPFGGFNKIKSEFGRSKEPDSFSGQVWWKKILIALGGVLGNIAWAILIFTICLSLGVPQVVESEGVPATLGVQVLAVNPSSPAEKAGILPGDIISKIDGEEFSSVEDVQTYIKEKNNISIVLEIKRGEKFLSLEVIPEPAKNVFSDLKEDYGVIGISLGETSLVSYPWYKSFILAIKQTFALIGLSFNGLWLMLKAIFGKGAMIGEVIGPVGLVSMSGQIAKVGFVYFLQTMGLLSVALAVCQLIPFPGLDGSRIIFALIEGAKKGRQIPQKIEESIISVGFCLLILLMIFVTYKDITKLIF